MHRPWCDSNVPLAIMQPRPCNCRASGPGPIPIGANPFEVGGMTGVAYPVGATGPTGMIGMTGVTGPARSHDAWMPNRDSATATGGGWQKFIERLGLSRWPETERTMLRGQDGWAFSTAVRFQRAACDLAESDESYYWSSYHLLALIIEKARSDLVFLEAIEALAVAHLYGGLSAADVTRQLKQIGVWP